MPRRRAVAQARSNALALTPRNAAMRTVSMMLVSASLLRHEATRCGPNVKIQLQVGGEFRI